MNILDEHITLEINTQNVNYQTNRMLTATQHWILRSTSKNKPNVDCSKTWNTSTNKQKHD